MPSIHELVPQLGDAKPEVAFKAFKDLHDMAARASAPGQEHDRADVAAGLAAELGAMTPAAKDKDGKEIPPVPVHSPAIRSKVARILALVAGAKEVPALAAALSDLEVRDMALFSLARNSSSQATEALIKALDGVGPVFLTGVVNALAKRKGTNVQAALLKTTKDEDAEVRLAAVEALANFPDPAHDSFIADAASCGCPIARARSDKARVRLAETLRVAGKKPAAKKVYEAILASHAAPPQKKAAEIGLKAIG